MVLPRPLGATDIVAERGDAAIEAVRQMTDGLGVEAALECVGTGESMSTPFPIVRSGGIVGAVGAPHDMEVPAEMTVAGLPPFVSDQVGPLPALPIRDVPVAN